MMEVITLAVAKHYKVLPQLLFINSRKREYMIPKQMAILLIRELTPYSYTRIGEYFKRGHATMMHAERTMKGEIEMVQERKFEYWELRNQLKNIRSKNENMAVKYCHPITYGLAS